MERFGHIKIIGPLTMDSRKNQVYIVPDVNLKLSQDEFEVLNMLAVRENISLSFEWLYRAIWDLTDNTDHREEAFCIIESIVNKINSSGAGFVWIDYDASDCYTFHTKWSQMAGGVK